MSSRFQIGLLVLLVAFSCYAHPPYGPEDDDGRGGSSHRSHGDGSSRPLLGADGHGQRGFGVSADQHHQHSTGGRLGANGHGQQGFGVGQNHHDGYSEYLSSVVTWKVAYSMLILLCEMLYFRSYQKPKATDEWPRFRANVSTNSTYEYYQWTLFYKQNVNVRMNFNTRMLFDM